MFVDIARFWWAVPLAVAGLPAFLALYYGLTAVAARRVGLFGAHGAIAFALLWFLTDYVRGFLFTGFPWNLEGYGFARILPLMQSVSAIGIYGLTLMTLVVSCLPACLVVKNNHNRNAVIAAFATLIFITAWGQGRLTDASNIMVPDVRMRLVQPNIDQSRKWVENETEKNFNTLLTLTSAPAEKPVSHIIWPETASTFYLIEEDVPRKMIAPHIPENGSLLTGVIRRRVDASGRIHYYNSLVAEDRKARIIAGYDKFHLVPFGEYIPMRSILPISPLIHLGVDFSHGDGPRSLRVPNLPSFSPLICYEVIFSGRVADKEDRPQFLVNVTNDGWYGKTAGPYQHLSIAKVRAIEEGLPLLRAANTGISAVVDPYGRTLISLGIDKEGFIDSDLPASLPPTFFSRYGDIPAWIFFFGLSLYVLIRKIKLNESN